MTGLCLSAYKLTSDVGEPSKSWHHHTLIRSLLVEFTREQPLCIRWIAHLR